MKFRVGQVVRVIGGPLAGCVTTVESELGPMVCAVADHLVYPCGIAGHLRPSHRLALRSLIEPEANAHAIPEWLEPYHEPGDYTSLSELLRGVVPAGKVDA